MVSLRPIVPEDRERMLDILTSDKVNKTYMLPDFEKREDAAPLFHRLMDMMCELHYHGIQASIDALLHSIANPVRLTRSAT